MKEPRIRDYEIVQFLGKARDLLADAANRDGHDSAPVIRLPDVVEPESVL